MSRFVILYQGVTDPSAQEERSLVSSLKRAKVIDRMPGTILVDGSEAEVSSVVKKLKKWTFSREGGAGVTRRRARDTRRDSRPVSRCRLVTTRRTLELRPRKDSNLRTRFRKPTLYPLSYGGPEGQGRGLAAIVRLHGDL